MTPIQIRLRELREARGWTQIELADRSAIPQPTISNIEAGKTSAISFDILEKLAKALECPASYLIVESGK